MRELVGGTNTPILVKNNSFVIKQYGYEQSVNRIAKRIDLQHLTTLKNDIETVKNSVLLPTPKTKEIFMVPDWLDYREVQNTQYNNIEFGRLVLIEEFIENEINIFDKDDIALVVNYIEKLPENVWLDIHPRNFRKLKEVIYLVDFVPPKIIEYQNDEMFEALFPQVKLRESARELRRRRRYTTTSGRLERFYYYLRLFQNNKITQQQNSKSG